MMCGLKDPSVDEITQNDQEILDQKQTYHSEKKRIQVGDIVTGAIGNVKPSETGKKVTKAKERRIGLPQGKIDLK